MKHRLRVRDVASTPPGPTARMNVNQSNTFKFVFMYGFVELKTFFYHGPSCWELSTFSIETGLSFLPFERSLLVNLATMEIQLSL